MVRLRIVGILAALLGAVGCYEAPKPACQFVCGTGNACPTGYECGDDSRCHRVESNGSLAACTDELPTDDAAAIDGATIDGEDLDAADLDAALIDAADIDAMEPPDAMPIDAMPIDAPACAGSYAVMSDGSGAARQALIMTELNPGSGGYIELYNNTGAAIDLDATAYELVSDTQSAPLATAGAGITIQPGGFATVTWPAAFTDVDGDGEVILYLDDDTGFDDGGKIMHYVCWGSHTGGRKAIAETAMKWTTAEPCPGALTMGAIHRLTNTNGVDAADYDVAAAPSPTNCE